MSDAGAANADQRTAWEGATGDFWAQNDAHLQASGRRYGELLLERAAIGAGERVLDIGCGGGAIVCEAARRCAPGQAMGIDLSPQLVEIARRRADREGLGNVEFRHGDAQTMALGPGAFDVAISRYGVMFFEDPLAAFTGFAMALAPGGRLVMVTWQPAARNEWINAPRHALAGSAELVEPPAGVPGMFGLAEAHRIGTILSTAGFDAVEVQEAHEPMWLGSDADDALAFIEHTGFAVSVLEGLDEAERGAARGRLRALLELRAGERGVEMGSAALVTTARRPARLERGR